MRLSWQTVVVIIGLSFGLGVLAAGHKVILARLGQVVTNLSLADASSNQTDSTTTANPGLTANSGNSKDSASQPALVSPSTNPDRPAPIGMEAPERGDVRLVVMSDINERFRSTTYGQEVLNAVQLIPGWQPDLVLSVGDMVAGQLLSLTPEEIQAMWAGFDRHIFQPIRQTGIPMAIAIGKHDGSNLIFEDGTEEIPEGVIPGTYVFAQERNGAAAYWTNPELDLGITILDQRRFPFQYTFVHNDIFYLVWDASSSELPDQVLRWAERNLASPEAQQAKMRISLSHFPLYAIAQGRDRPSEFISRGQEVQELLEQYDVHTHIAGHHHAYFAGHVGDLELLYTGALGIGPRSWLGTDTSPQRTLTVMDIFFDRLPEPQEELTDDDLEDASDLASLEVDTIPPITTVYTTYNMATGEVIEQDELPRVIAGPTGLVLRQGVERRDLTYEDNQRYIRSW